MTLAELSSFVAERRVEAVRAREVVEQLSDQEERQEILRYADDLDREIAKLDAQIAEQKATQHAIDVI